jgi:hypothetical protein
MSMAEDSIDAVKQTDKSCMDGGHLDSSIDDYDESNSFVGKVMASGRPMNIAEV